MEVRWLLEEATGMTWPQGLDDLAPARSGAYFDAMVARRAAGEPLQYVLGHWAFRTLDLMVDPRVLIPRPETEEVVEVALAELDRLQAATANDVVAVDLGTGSGAIALSMVAERPRVLVWGTDASADALAVARANLAGLGGFAATRVRLAHGSWWEPLPAALRGEISLLVANPPYITSAEMADLDPVVVDWEPRGALEAGPNGTEDIVTILEGALEWLAPQAVVVIELAPGLVTVASSAARDAGFAEVEVHRDLAGRDRILVARTVPGGPISGNAPVR
jgi:release factor glutamine methyltransferase